MASIPFNKPHLTGKETRYIREAVKTLKISGNGEFTRKCQEFFEQRYGFKKCLLTNSCTDALEMCAILLDIKPGDEVIIPSYTFVSSANAFVLRGAEIVFADSSGENPNIDGNKIEELITERTKAIVVVHYAGIACNMDKITRIAREHGLFVVEDAAQAIDSFHNREPLGSIGHLAAVSFHETKNIISGEGGMLIINDERFRQRAEIVWEKGTNRAAFWRGEVDKYGWVDIGSSFLPSEITAAFLYAQLEKLDAIQEKRKRIWQTYYDSLSKLEEDKKIKLPCLPPYSTNNGHLFYLVCGNAEERNSLIDYLKTEEINAVFHYQSLHKSPYFRNKYEGSRLQHSETYSDCLVRLPFYYGMTGREQDRVCTAVKDFFYKQNREHIS
ncbi:MAG TPA: dTDP-4-amino-4,6-dideoxygalactose transaminase [Ignavibacteria bacterium]|nr:dTDP-4-amino-4,6-dideoxygalactose transaminase [Ignavibacteria bacterium]